MSDPFAYFMEVWVPSVGLNEAFSSWQLKDAVHEAAYVVPDIEAFRDTTGTEITGRRAWKEHLKRMGAEEFSRMDLARATEERFRKVQAQRRKPSTEITHPDKPIQPAEPSATTRRVLERLHGRPAPDRKTLIQIAIEERTRK